VHNNHETISAQLSSGDSQDVRSKDCTNLINNTSQESKKENQFTTTFNKTNPFCAFEG